MAKYSVEQCELCGKMIKGRAIAHLVGGRVACSGCRAEHEAREAVAVGQSGAEQACDGQGESQVAETLQQLAGSRMCAAISYRKTGEDWTTDRVIEPYELQHNAAGNLMVLAWQVKPVLDGEAWRNFRLDKIVQIASAGVPYAPRRRITICDGEVSQFHFKAEPRVGASRPSLREQYVTALRQALDDLRVTENELEHLAGLARGLTREELLALHAQVLSLFLSEVAMDGRVDEREEKIIAVVRQWLGVLGGCP